jgi:hypothetical protein
MSDTARALTALDWVEQSGGKSLTLASDDAYFNVETLILAREIRHVRYRAFSVGTVVYDIVAGRSVDQSLATLRQSDAAALHYPPNGSAPEWANRSVDNLLAFLNTHSECKHVLSGERDLILYRLATIDNLSARDSPRAGC